MGHRGARITARRVDRSAARLAVRRLHPPHTAAGSTRLRRMAWTGIKAEAAETSAAIFLTMDTEAMQMAVAPGKDDLPGGMEDGQRHITADAEAAPDEWGKARHNQMQVVDSGGKVRGLHRRSVSEDRRGFTLTPPRISRSPNLALHPREPLTSSL